MFVINFVADATISGHFSGSGLALDAVRTVVIAIPLVWLDRYLKTAPPVVSEGWRTMASSVSTRSMR